MRKDPSNPKYIKAEVPTPWSNRSYNQRVIKIEVVGQTVETEDSMEITNLDSGKIIETTIFKRTLEDMEDKIIEMNIEIICTIIIIGVGID